MLLLGCKKVHLKEKQVSALCMSMNTCHSCFSWPLIIQVPDEKKEWGCFASVTFELASIKRI